MARLVGLVAWMAVACLAWALSYGPVGRLVANEALPPSVLVYQRPIQSLADQCPPFARLRTAYLQRVWRVDEPLLR